MILDVQQDQCLCVQPCVAGSGHGAGCDRVPGGHGLGHHSDERVYGHCCVGCGSDRGRSDHLRFQAYPWSDHAVGLVKLWGRGRRVLPLLLLLLLVSFPASAYWQAPSVNQVGVKTFGTVYQATPNSLLVTVQGIIHKTKEEEFNISISSQSSGPFFPLALKHMKPFSTDNTDTISALVPSSYFYQVQSLSGADVIGWYEQGDIEMPIEVALTGLWVLSFLGGVLVGRL